MSDTDSPRRRDHVPESILAAADERTAMTPERVGPALEQYVETREGGAAALRLRERGGAEGAWISAVAPRENEQ